MTDNSQKNEDPKARWIAAHGSPHQRMIAKGLITPARERFQVISPPLKLEGKPLSQYLNEIRG